jgi:hypothetical protein
MDVLIPALYGVFNVISSRTQKHSILYILFVLPLCSFRLCGKTDCIGLKGFELGTPHYNSDGLFQPSLSDTTRQQRNRW